MNLSRRDFLQRGATIAAGVAVGAVSDVTAAGEHPATVCLDYGRSFICNTAAFNAVRFWVESRTTLMDAQGSVTMEFYQCGSCKSENTFAERSPLFSDDNYDFLPILGGKHWLIFRRKARLTADYRRIQRTDEVWGAPDLKLQFARQITVLDTFDKIRAATAAALPLVAQTEISNADSGLRAVIEYPVKTMNISAPRQKYQVDTGPIAFPDLAKRYEPAVDCLRLAFVAFNAPHFADFVIEQPTPVVENGKEVTKIFHYSTPFTMPAKNIVFALGTL
jgi:hypothetical protein